MAITKIHAIKSTLNKALDYIENPDKTDGQLLLSGYNTEPQLAALDFEMTATLARKVRYIGRKSPNLAYHLIGPGSEVELLEDGEGNYRLRAAVPRAEQCMLCGSTKNLIRLDGLCLCDSCAHQVVKIQEERKANHEISEST